MGEEETIVSFHLLYLLFLSPEQPSGMPWWYTLDIVRNDCSELPKEILCEEFLSDLMVIFVHQEDTFSAWDIGYSGTTIKGE